MTFQQQLLDGTQYVKKSDSVLEEIINKIGPCTIKLQKDYYTALVSSIISQQLSVKAADTIYSRFLDLIQHNLVPSEVLGFEKQTLRTVGLSNQKSSYILDLSQKFHENPGIYNHLEDLDDKSAIEHLTMVKGIGEWTAHMFLMFSLGRLDVLPHGDVGFQNALKEYYNLAVKPDRAIVEKLSSNWRPFRTIGVWYLWAIMDQNM
jgi:DNA-3-methyladenine glycosylase II